MAFSSVVFLFVFLPVSLLLYYLINPRFKNYLLILLSLIFYFYCGIKCVVILLISILVNWMFAMLVSSAGNSHLKNLFLTFAIIVNLVLLFVFRYLNFAIENINLLFNAAGLNEFFPRTDIVQPIGISFITFHALSYVIDVRQGKTEVQRNLLYVALYLTLFPKLLQGPIVRYGTIANEISRRKENIADFSGGIKRFIVGLAKKAIVADTLGVMVNTIFSSNDLSSMSVCSLWLGAVGYTLQLYYDFSGYSDMALGLGLMFGFHFDENFNFPYMTESVSGFWRRWHISLSTWFRDYVYFPLGGSRVRTRFRIVINLFVVWVLTGIWHGANWTFICWGFFYFVLIAFEKLSGWPNKFKSSFPRIVYRIFALLCIVLAWVMFRSDNVLSGTNYIAGMFGLNGNCFIDRITHVYFSQYYIILTIAAVFSTPVYTLIKGRLHMDGIVYSVVSTLAMVALALVSIAFAVSGSYNAFLYFNF